jgi:multidrug efflux pump
VVFSILQASPNSTIDQTGLFATQVHDVYKSFPETASIFQLINPTGGFGGMVTKPWSERTKTAQQLLVEVTGPLSKIPGIRAIPLTPPPLPGGGDFPVDFVIASAAEPQQLQGFADQIVQRAFASGLFIFADSDLKFDQPQAEVVFDRDKLRSQGVDLRQAGQDLSTLMGGNYVNRFSIQGRSYKVIPQVIDTRSDGTNLHHGISGQARAFVDFRNLADDSRAAGAEEISAAKRRTHSGSHPAAGSA